MHQAITSLKRQQWSIFVAMIVSLLMCLTGLAQNPQQRIRCVLEPSSTEILPFEPLYLTISLVNEASEELDAEVVPHALARIGILDDRQIKWGDPFAERAPSGPPLPPRRIKLSPNERLTLFRPIHTDTPTPQRAFIQAPGTFYVQGILLGANQRFESEPVKVRILEPQGSDAAAYKYLRTKGMGFGAVTLPPALRKSHEQSGNALPTYGLHEIFFFENIFGWDYGQEAIDELLKFADEFPKSRYAQYARLGAGLIRLYTHSDQRDLEKAASLFQEVARTSDEDMTAQAYYYLGKVAEERGEFMDAQQYYSRALSLKINPYFKYLTEKAQVQVKQRRR
jgi:tetratricopeptide (TPR) repeat protein